MEDFARATKFEQFYMQHRAYYQQVLEDAKHTADVNAQQAWLEQRFPRRYQQYRIVFSPLMYGTHFTQRFKSGGRRCIMWVSGYHGDSSFSETLNAARYVGIVMTEVDHNYVNPVSSDYKKKLKTLMGESNRANWVSPSYSSNSYKNGYKVFNEYMTHAVYLLYTNGKLTASEQEIIEKMKINAMQNRRGFSNFGSFYYELKGLYMSAGANQDIASLYPRMLTWCEEQNRNRAGSK